MLFMVTISFGRASLARRAKNRCTEVKTFQLIKCIIIAAVTGIISEAGDCMLAAMVAATGQGLLLQQLLSYDLCPLSMQLPC